MKKRHSEERIIYALRRIEGGTKGLEVCLEIGISEQTLYNWKRKYSGMGTIEVRRLNELEDAMDGDKDTFGKVYLGFAGAGPNGSTRRTTGRSVQVFARCIQRR